MSARVDINGLFAGLLTIVFITLKLTDVIAWSWWWVLSPLWINALFAAVVLAVVLIVVAKAARKAKTWGPR